MQILYFDQDLYPPRPKLILLVVEPSFPQNSSSWQRKAGIMTKTATFSQDYTWTA